VGAAIYCADAEAYTQFSIFDSSALKKDYLIFYLFVKKKYNQFYLSMRAGVAPG